MRFFVAVVALCLLVPAAAFVLRPALESLAEIAGNVVRILGEFATALSRRLAPVEQAACRRFRSALSGVTRGESTAAAENPAWDVIVRPIWTFVIFALLVLADFYTSALAAAPLIGTAPPHMHKIDIAVLLGVLWTAIAAAFGQLVFELFAISPARPWNSVSARTRRCLRAVAVAGLVTVMVAGALFFVWRQGQIHAPTVGPDGLVKFDGSNPLGFLRWPLIATLGLLLQISVALLSWSAFAVISLVSIALYTVVWFAIAASRAALALMGAVLVPMSRVVTTVFSIATVLAQRILELAARIARWAGVAVAWLYARSLVLGLAFWAVVIATGGALGRVGGAIGDALRSVGRGIRAVFVGIGKGIRAVGIGIWAAIVGIGAGIRTTWFAVGRAIATIGVTVWRAACATAGGLAAAVTAVVQSVASAVKAVTLSLAFVVKTVAVSIWRLLTAPFRAVDAVWNWICRFKWAQRLQLRPRGYGGPPHEYLPPPSYVD